MHAWVEAEAAHIARRSVRELEALVGVSSPSGDNHGAEEAVALCAALLAPEAEIERVPCSTPGYAPDLLARVHGEGAGRILLLGHLDTVVNRDAHRTLVRDGDRLVGSGAVDMKGGVVLAIGVLNALAARRDALAELALLLVTDVDYHKAAMPGDITAKARVVRMANQYSTAEAYLYNPEGELIAGGTNRCRPS